MSKIRFLLQNTYILLVIVFFVAIFLRFYHLSSNPPSLDWDEAAWGYNAYSLGIDGRDEFGRFLPVDYLESFGDFKPPMYAYLTVLPVKLFGLNAFSTRFASAFFGFLTVIATYFLVKQIFYDENQKKLIALLSSFFLAISPWHINLSRAAFEANVATFFIVCGVWLFLFAMREKKWLLILSIASFFASVYTFNTARIVSPLLVFVLCMRFHKTLFKCQKQTLVAGFVGILLVLPLIPFLLSPQANLRFREVNIFSDITVTQHLNQEVANDHNTVWSKIFHHRYLAFTTEYVKHYLDNLTPSFLFIQGDGNPRFSTQEVGQMFLWDLPFFIIGLFYLFRKRVGAWWIVPVWLMIGIIPAATARETPHALRIEATLPTFQIITACGVVWSIMMLSRIKNFQRKKIIIVGFLGILLCANFFYYFDEYHTFYPIQYASEWQYGYKDAMLYTKTVSSQYDKMYFTESLGRPYIYALFYTQYDPKVFRQEAKIEREALGFVHVHSFGKYQFFTTKSVDEPARVRTLVINAPGNVPSNVKIVKIFTQPNGNPVLVSYTQ